MSGDTDLQRIARIIAISEANVLRFIEAKIYHLKEFFMSALDDATAATAAKVAALSTEVANANAKTDAALAALAASVASGQPATQAQIDAITAIGTQADAATGSLQAEESKVDADLNPPAPAPAAPVDGSAPSA